MVHTEDLDTSAFSSIINKNYGGSNSSIGKLTGSIQLNRMTSENGLHVQKSLTSSGSYFKDFKKKNTLQNQPRAK